MLNIKTGLVLLVSGIAILTISNIIALDLLGFILVSLGIMMIFYLIVLKLIRRNVNISLDTKNKVK